MSKKATKRDKGKTEDEEGVTFTIKIYCEPTVLEAHSKTAYDCQFSFHFPGEKDPVVTPARSTWTDILFTKEIVRESGKDLLLLLEEMSSMQVFVEEKSCPFTMAKEEDPGTSKGKKGKGKKPAVELAPGEDPPIEPPDGLAHAPFEKVFDVSIPINSFIMDSNPLKRVFDVEHPLLQGVPRPPPSIQMLSVEVTVNKVLLTDELATELLPMQIIVHKAEGLPCKPYPYETMPDYYSPVYTSYSFYNKFPESENTEPDTNKKSKKPSKKDTAKKPEKGKKGAAVPEPKDPQTPKGADGEQVPFEEEEPPPPPPPEQAKPEKLVKTDGLPHGPNLKWDHSQVFFLGRLDLAALADHYESEPLVMELHDRDISMQGLRKAAIMNRGGGMSIARMLMVSPEDDVDNDLPPEKPGADEEGGGTTHSTSRSKSSRKSDKNSRKKSSKKDAANEKEEEAARAVAAQKRMEALAAKNLRGVCLFRLTDMFRGALDFTLTSPIVTKFPPRGTKLKPFQMTTGPYDEASQLTIRVRLQKRLPTLPTKISHQFNRVIFILRYNDTHMLNMIVDSVKRANLRALKMEDRPWTDLSTVRLTQEERDKLSQEDVITGVQVIDPDYRLFILEGLAVGSPKAKAIQEVTEAVPRISANHKDYKILSDESITFYKRLYMGFDVDIKKLKLIQPASVIAADKNVHINKRIPQNCYRAFCTLVQIQAASRLRMTKAMDMFPSIHELLSLEKWYGDFVSDEDLGLVTRKPSRRTQRVSTRVTQAQSNSFAFSLEESDSDESEQAEQIVHRVDCYNPEYLSSLPVSQIKRDTHNYIKAGMKDLRDDEMRATMRTKGFHQRPADVYGSSTYTYGKGNAPEPELDLEAMKRNDVLREQERQRTESWFNQEENFKVLHHVPWNQHHKKPHYTRVDDLNQPWIENELNPRPEPLPRGGIKVPLKIGGEFGMPDNPMWGTSVHLTVGAAGREKQEQEDKDRARHEFESRLVVDDPTFKVYRKSEHRHKVNSLDKHTPILKNAPMAHALKYNVRLKKTQKKVGPIREYSPAMFSEGDYNEPSRVLRDAMVRKTIPRDPNMHPKDYENFYPYHSYTQKAAIKPTKSFADIKRRTAGIRTNTNRPLSM